MTKSTVTKEKMKVQENSFSSSLLIHLHL